MISPQISFSRRAISRTLAVATAIILLLSVMGQLWLYLTPRESPWGIVGLFNVDFEMNVPTFYQVLVLLAAVLLPTIIAILKRQARAPFVVHWWLLALGFFVIANDEFYALHEKLSEPLRRWLGLETMGVLHFAWVIPAFVLVIALALFYYPFLRHLDRSTRTRFFGAALIYLGGALGVELIGGRYAEVHGTWNLTYSLITTVEEGMEMAGAVLFVDALLRYLQLEYGAVRLAFLEADKGRGIGAIQSYIDAHYSIGTATDPIPDSVINSYSTISTSEARAGSTSGGSSTSKPSA
jgi:hypothetical protein